MEKLLFQLDLPMISSMVEYIVTVGYNLTGNKFSVNFNGSKGYLSNIEILAEGKQSEGKNIIWAERFMTKNGRLMHKEVKIFYSREHGVRVVVE